MEPHQQQNSLENQIQHLEDDLSALYRSLEVSSTCPRVDFILESLSPATKQSLEEFIRGTAITHECLGYCLFFEKPMGWLDVSIYPERYKIVVNYLDGSGRSEVQYNTAQIERELIYQEELMRGVDAWNEALNGEGNLIFKRTKRELFDPPGAAPNGTEHLFVLHVPSLIKVITANKDLFDEVLGEQKSPRAIVDAILSCESITEMFAHDEAIFGLLLGFGRSNAVAYREEQKNLAKIGNSKTGYREDRQGVGNEACKLTVHERKLHERSHHVAPASFVCYEDSDSVAQWNERLANQRFILGTLIKEDDQLLRRCLSYALGHAQCPESLRWPLV